MVKQIQVSPAAKASAVIKQSAAAVKKTQVKTAAAAKIKTVAPAAKNIGNKQPGCKWCQKGECWSHGGAAKPAGKNVAKQGQDAETQAMLKMLKGSGNPQMVQQFMQLTGGMDGDAAAAHPGNSKKQLLLQSHAKALGKCIKKGEEISYEVNEVGEGDEKFQAMVTIADQTFAGEASRSKKEAEESAAEMALNDLYPDAKPKAAKQAAGIKRKGAPEELHPKSQLSQAVQVIKGEPTTKDDVVVTVEESNGSYKAVIVVAVLKNAKFTGTGASKKDAETAAANAALRNGALKSKLAAAKQAKAANKAK